MRQGEGKDQGGAKEANRGRRGVNRGIPIQVFRVPTTCGGGGAKGANREGKGAKGSEEE